MSETTDIEAEDQWDVTQVRCHRCTALSIHSKNHAAEDHSSAVYLHATRRR